MTDQTEITPIKLSVDSSDAQTKIDQNTSGPTTDGSTLQSKSHDFKSNNSTETDESTNQETVKENPMKKYGSRKFIVTLITLLIPIANQVFGLNLEPEALLGMFGLAGAYNGAQGYVDSKKQ